MRRKVFVETEDHPEEDRQAHANDLEGSDS